MLYKRLKNKGFTLIEVITVMAIIAIISSIAIPKISSYIDRANQTKIIAAISELNNFMIIEFSDKKINNLSDVLLKYGELDKLKINLNTSGSFEIGKIKGNLILENEFITAHISEPENLSGKVIGK